MRESGDEEELHVAATEKLKMISSPVLCTEMTKANAGKPNIGQDGYHFQSPNKTPPCWGLLCRFQPIPPAKALPLDKEKGSKWSRWFLFLPGVITFGLGTWKIFRRQDKINVLDYRQKRLEMEPLKLNDMSPSSEILETLEFRRVVCNGVFDNGRSIYIGPRSRSISGVTENGYYVITPLMPIPGDAESVQSPVLVNRGWVPRSWRDKSFEVLQDGEKSSSMDAAPAQQNEQSWWGMFRSKKQKAVEDQAPAISSVEVIGVVRGSEKPSIFVPANDPNSGQWFYVDIPAIAVACGLPKDTLLIEDINENVNPSNPYPIPKDVNSLVRSSVMPQDHLNYTLTWNCMLEHPVEQS
ncbi:hypothetical protein V6N13_060191 [Hibiscus sabdariffa]